MATGMARAVGFGLVILMAVGGAAAPAGAARLAQEQACVVAGDKVASPARVLLGETVQIRLTLQAECPPAVYREADIVLVLDQSISMASDGKLQAARAAARTFVDRTDLALHRIGLVTFANQITTWSMGLSADRDQINQSIAAIDIKAGTNIAGGIDAAAELIRTQARAGTLRVMLLMSDGSPNAPTPDPRTAAVRSANFAKLDDIQIYSIGLGSDADASLMESLASAPEQYRFAPAAEDLASIYEEIAVVVGASAVKNLVLTDDLAADVSLSAGTTSPAADVNGQRLTWHSLGLSGSGLTWVYQVKPTRAGTYATNDRAVVVYENADGSSGQFVFPRPEITVVDPNEGVPCNQPGAWTLLIHAFPDSVGQSRDGVPGCNNRFDAGDWMGGTYPGLPRLEFQVSDATGVRVLYRGKGVSGPGSVEQRLHIRLCEPPPYRVRLLTADLNGYTLCPNSPGDRLVSASLYRRNPFKNTEIRYGFFR